MEKVSPAAESGVELGSIELTNSWFTPNTRNLLALSIFTLGPLKLLFGSPTNAPIGIANADAERAFSQDAIVQVWYLNYYSLALF